MATGDPSMVRPSGGAEKHGKQTAVGRLPHSVDDISDNRSEENGVSDDRRREDWFMSELARHETRPNNLVRLLTLCEDWWLYFKPTV